MNRLWKPALKKWQIIHNNMLLKWQPLFCCSVNRGIQILGWHWLKSAEIFQNQNMILRKKYPQVLANVFPSPSHHFPLNCSPSHQQGHQGRAMDQIAGQHGAATRQARKLADAQPWRHGWDSQVKLVKFRMESMESQSFLVTCAGQDSQIWNIYI